MKRVEAIINPFKLGDVKAGLAEGGVAAKCPQFGPETGAREQFNCLNGLDFLLLRK